MCCFAVVGLVSAMSASRYRPIFEHRDQSPPPARLRLVEGGSPSESRSDLEYGTYGSDDDGEAIEMAIQTPRRDPTGIFLSNVQTDSAIHG